MQLPESVCEGSGTQLEEVGATVAVGADADVGVGVLVAPGAGVLVGSATGIVVGVGLGGQEEQQT